MPMNEDSAQGLLKKELKIPAGDEFSSLLQNELLHIFEERPGAEELFSEEKGSELPPQNQLFKPKVKNRETFMNTESDIFSSPKSVDNGLTQNLTKRLYSHATEAIEQNLFQGSLPEANYFALEELKRLALSPEDMGPAETAMANDSGQASKLDLEKRMASFQLVQKALVKKYTGQKTPGHNATDFSMYYLNGWPSHLSGTPYSLPLLLTESSRQTTGGIFLRWNGKGIVINPGTGFLGSFHAQGLHIHDIDYVIVTGSHSSCHADVRGIYDLNYELNKDSPTLHLIHYYFNNAAFQELSRSLKPHFKQERETLHSLEIFLDSPDVEKVELTDDITLHYFLTSNRETFSSGNPNLGARPAKSHSELGLKLEMKSNSLEINEKDQVRIGYIGHCSWNPLMAHHLGYCDLLVTAFGHATPNDINKISYNTDCLGCYGTYTLLEEVAPQLLLCGEFSGKEGDIRLEACQKIRSAYQAQMQTAQRDLSTILPGDIGMHICLKTMSVKCSITDEWVPASQVKVIKTTDSFGKLIYLSPNCCY